jgi:selenocysteine lyase/cysteine desulfurase
MNNNINDLKDLTTLLYNSGRIPNPFKNTAYNDIIFADDVASGRPCRAVDHYVMTNIYPYYSNTHSNASCGIMMKNMISQTKEIIREHLKLDDHHKIIFTGNGCTGAINHLANKIDFTKHKNVHIHITPFEHHSNYLPWVEKQKIHKNIHIHFMECDDGFDLKPDEFIHQLDSEYLSNDKNKGDKHDLNIVSIIACSNVTGRRYDLQFQKVWEYIQTKKSTNDIYLLYDHACSGPHIDIDVSQSDGIFLSGHKFLGGQCTPGLLIVNQELLETKAPYNPGGGCVEKANSQCVVYKPDLESKEMGGTPNVVGIIRLGYILLVKHAIWTELELNESIITRYANERMRELTTKYDNFKVIGFDSRKDTDLPIYPIIIEGQHYNFITILFNDLYGIQTRGGISCCGMFGELCEDKLHVSGWCRICFSYLMKAEEVEKIFEALEFIIQHGEAFMRYYKYDKKVNLYSLK